MKILNYWPYAIHFRYTAGIDGYKATVYESVPPLYAIKQETPSRTSQPEFEDNPASNNPSTDHVKLEANQQKNTANSNNAEIQRPFSFPVS